MSPTEEIVRICRHLDGLPPALELAAARVKVLSLADIGSQIHARFRLLQRGPPDGPARHQTRARALEWSYVLLTTGEKVLFRLLSNFRGGATFDAIAAVDAATREEQPRCWSGLPRSSAKAWPAGNRATLAADRYVRAACCIGLETTPSHSWSHVGLTLAGRR